MRDFTDLAEGTAWATGIFILLGVFLHWFFFICGLGAFGFFLFLTAADLRQQSRRPSYHFMFDEGGNIVGIECHHCGQSSDKQEDVEAKICSFCGRSLDAGSTSTGKI